MEIEEKDMVPMHDEAGKTCMPVCRLGILSFFLGLLSLGMALVFGILCVEKFQSEEVVFIRAMLILLTSVSAFVLALVSHARICSSRGCLSGIGYTQWGEFLPCVVLVILVLAPALARTRSIAFRMTCGTNLSGIGKAMLIYANDYEDELPRAGGRTNNWMPSLLDWTANTRQQAYGVKGGASTGQVTTSSSFYLLVKYAEVTPKSFVCTDEKDTEEFKLSKWRSEISRDKELIDLWDFGRYVNKEKNSTRYCSYAYHVPFSSYALTVSHDPAMAVAADRSPWCDPDVNTQLAWSRFIPDLEGYPGEGNVETAKLGNSRSNGMEGQNVLYLDSHVSFEKRPFVGIDHDNIYTWQNSSVKIETAKGNKPVVYRPDMSKPRNRRDSVLVQENSADKVD